MLNKVSLSRRLKTFMAKWGGILVASILVIIIAIFGSMYLYDAGRVNGTLAWVTQNINLAVIGQSDRLENPPRAIYRFIMQLENPTADSAVITVSDLNVLLDEFTQVAEPYGLWEKTVSPTGKVNFEGDITLTAETLNTLVSRGRVNLEITGNIHASSEHGLVNKEAERPINIKTTIDLKVN
jgi:hypothetical protein